MVEDPGGDAGSIPAAGILCGEGRNCSHCLHCPDCLRLVVVGLWCLPAARPAKALPATQCSRGRPPIQTAWEAVWGLPAAAPGLRHPGVRGVQLTAALVQICAVCYWRAGSAQQKLLCVIIKWGDPRYYPRRGLNPHLPRIFDRIGEDANEITGCGRLDH